MSVQPAKAILHGHEGTPQRRQLGQVFCLGLERVRLKAVDASLKLLNAGNHFSTGHAGLSMRDQNHSVRT